MAYYVFELAAGLSVFFAAECGSVEGRGVCVSDHRLFPWGLVAWDWMAVRALGAAAWRGAYAAARVPSAAAEDLGQAAGDGLGTVSGDCVYVSFCLPDVDLLPVAGCGDGSGGFGAAGVDDVYGEQRQLVDDWGDAGGSGAACDSAGMVRSGGGGVRAGSVCAAG